MDDPQLEKFRATARAGWAHFAPLEATTTLPAADLVRFARIHGGRDVLDVATGTGVVAVTAARAGARVTGLDLTPELVEVARGNATTAGVTVRWEVGDVEALPFADGSFDVVVSQFGHMFAPRPEQAVREMLRVLRVGGTLAFSTWPPELLLGRMFALTGRYSPPPPGVPAPELWGDPTVVRERLGSAVRDLTFDRGVVRNAVLSPAHHRLQSERCSGPVRRFLGTEADPERVAAFRREYDALAGEYFDGNVVRQDYLLTRAVKA